MKSKTTFQSAADRRLRIMLGAIIVWLLVVLLIGFWWGSLLLGKAKRIAELESQLGIAFSETLSQWERTQRMLFWEGGSFVVLLLGSTSVLFWFYWRDLRRARGVEAFFASLTHELRTPLTSIRLQAESIADQLGRDSDQKILLDRLLDDSVRLETQVERTLELARLEGGGPVFTQGLSIKPWMERFLKNSDYTRLIEFDFSVEDEQITADPVALHVILKNIFENSIKHSGRDRVKVLIRTLHSLPGFVTLQVKDSGVGLEECPKDLGKIFNKGESSQGAGVGLYLVKTLMHKMHGSVDFIPGTTGEGFEVRLVFQRGAGVPS